jgi:tRNA threonylcarbamoyladenosine biosynthesis protein TsaE
VILRPAVQTVCVRADSGSAEETELAGERLARDLVPGDVVLVSGELGTGKTTFVRGACRALGVTATVTSPTFTIGQLYAGRVSVAHVDLYRIAARGEALDGEDAALLEDYLAPDRVAFVEWPEAAGRVLERITVRVRIEHRGGDRRMVSVT